MHLSDTSRPKMPYAKNAEINYAPLNFFDNEYTV
jgi:hypothetical protein